ncbi:MAG: hypothetical protein QXL78_00515 [Methanocellales archaeon]
MRVTRKLETGDSYFDVYFCDECGREVNPMMCVEIRLPFNHESILWCLACLRKLGLYNVIMRYQSHFADKDRVWR